MNNIKKSVAHSLTLFTFAEIWFKQLFDANIHYLVQIVVWVCSYRTVIECINVQEDIKTIFNKYVEIGINIIVVNLYQLVWFKL